MVICQFLCLHCHMPSLRFRNTPSISDYYLSYITYESTECLKQYHWLRSITQLFFLSEMLILSISGGLACNPNPCDRYGWNKSGYGCGLGKQGYVTTPNRQIDQVYILLINDMNVHYLITVFILSTPTCQNEKKETKN